MNNINYSLSLKMGQLLKEQGMHIAAAESCTGGALATVITSAPGCSAYFDRSLVTYTNEAKHELLQVPTELLDQYGAVSEQVAAAMASGLLANSHADIAVSITGIAGPQGGTPEKPVGLVWFGLATRNGVCETRSANFGGGRKQVRSLAVGFILEWVINLIES
jgi:nicotinamide-nucleotide amidase